MEDDIFFGNLLGESFIYVMKNIVNNDKYRYIRIDNRSINSIRYFKYITNFTLSKETIECLETYINVKEFFLDVFKIREDRNLRAIYGIKELTRWCFHNLSYHSLDDELEIL